MTQSDDDPGLRILKHIQKRRDRREKISNLPEGLTVHVIERSRTFGPGQKIEGVILIETAEGIRRASGKDIAQLANIAPDFLRHWRLDRDG